MSAIVNCRDETVLVSARTALDAVERSKYLGNLEALCVVASRLDCPVVSTNYAYEFTGRCHAEIAWIVEAPGAGLESKVVLALPAYSHHRLRPGWQGSPLVILVGNATAEDAQTLLAGFAARLAV